MIKVKQFFAGSCLSYVLEAEQEALIIDPHISLKNDYVNFIRKRKLKLKFIIDTHSHADHFSLAAILKKEFNAPVLMYEKAISNVATQRLKDNDDINLGNEIIKVIYAPGHTDDTVNLYTAKYLFTADVLLIGSVGRTDFQNGSPESMFDTLQRLKKLPDETIVYPGHDYHQKRSTTIKREKQENPFIRQDDKDVFVKDMRSKKLAKPFNIDNIIRLNQKGEAVSLETISPKEANEFVHKDLKTKLLDVRSVLEFAEEHIEGAQNIPIDTLASRIKELSDSGNSYIVLCRTGNRSPMAADMLLQSGMHNVKVMDGGMIRWKKEKLGVIKGVGGISIERQVRASAGTLVLLGVLLAFFVHPGFIAITIFVSCGLIYSGLSDNCLMGMLLMKLPYNKKLYSSKLDGGTCSIGG
ncbi:MAG: MBL fold metallo-hydrolase [Candidatus Omnitrophota bacterium]|nr:MAG: MBL fold metallo-hydrolase [Candidatus Omnitrophota bacterium]